MRCNHQLVTEHLADFVDGNLSHELKRQVQTAIDNCAECQTVYNRAVSFAQASSHWQDQTVPEWHRTEYAVKPRSTQNAWLSWSALATSSIAILMVIFQVNIQSNESGLTIAFGNSSNQQVEALIEERLAEFQSQQSVLIDAKLIAQSEKQATNNKLVVAKILEKTRDERRDDLNFLVTGIQSQRYQDQREMEQQLTALADNQIENNQYLNKLIQSANLNKGEVE